MMESPITTECEALRQEIELLAAENRRLLNALKVPAYPEKEVRAVWRHGRQIGISDELPVTWGSNAEEVSRIFVEALRDA